MVTLSLDLVNDIDADRFDIEESFEALDVHKTGRLGFDRAYILLLGLGYLENYKKNFSFSLGMLKEFAKKIESDLQDDRDDEWFELGIKLETLLKIIATHPALLQRNRSVNFAQIGFELIDHDRKGFIDASDIQRLGSDVENVDNNIQEEVTISTDEAKAMIETTNDMFAQNEDHGNNHQINPLVFQKLLAPPSP